MNGKQKAALKGLEKAFRECKEAGIVFHGMDGALLAFSKSDYDRLEDPHGSIGSDGPISLPDTEGCQDYMVNVDTHDTYIDSGGW